MINELPHDKVCKFVAEHFFLAYMSFALTATVSIWRLHMPYLVEMPRCQVRKGQTGLETKF